MRRDLHKRCGSNELGHWFSERVLAFSSRGFLQLYLGNVCGHLSRGGCWGTWNSIFVIYQRFSVVQFQFSGTVPSGLNRIGLMR